MYFISVTFWLAYRRHALHARVAARIRPSLGQGSHTDQAYEGLEPPQYTITASSENISHTFWMKNDDYSIKVRLLSVAIYYIPISISFYLDRCRMCKNLPPLLFFPGCYNLIALQRLYQILHRELNE